MEHLMEILQWLIPSGGLGMLLGWVTSRRIRNARTRQEEHDVYLKMYEDTKRTLVELNEDNTQMLRRLARLEVAILKSRSCRYFHPHCPLRIELQNVSQRRTGASEDRDLKNHLRSHEPLGSSEEDSRDRPDRDGDIDTLGGEPP